MPRAKLVPPLSLAGVLAAVLCLGGCAVAEGLFAADVAAVPVIGRAGTDAIVSLVAGRDCSIVRLDEGKSYCRPIEAPPEPPPYCTRSLGHADCWADPLHLPKPTPPQLADGPMLLTPAQEADRTARWPKL